MYKYFFVLIIIFSSYNTKAQTIDEIKRDRQHFIWGEGNGSTLKKADQEALAMLISQITTTVESQFEQFTEEDRVNEDFDLTEKVKSVIKTYSNATLHNTERIVISNEPDAKVFRYIHRDNINKVFEARKNKIFSFTNQAIKAEKEIRIADALRYYYASLLLLKSHPECNYIKYTDDQANELLLISWIPGKMNEIFSKINYYAKDIREGENMKTVYLNVTYNGKQIVNLDYSYWDGRDWTNLYSVKSGSGFLEFYGANAKDQQSAKIKTEYMYENLAQIDDELESVMEKIDPIPYRRSYFNLSFDSPVVEKEITEEVIEEAKITNIVSIDIADDYEEVITKVIHAIDNKQYENVRSLFTDNGYEMYSKLISYGKASIVNKDNLKVYKFNDEIMCRSIRMAFNFENNFKKFVEDVVFHFNENGKIESLSFALNEVALKSILENNTWEEADRLVLVNFLEHFKTAYALERLDYIESIFADDALIITGYYVSVKSGVENKYRDNKILRYNRQSKQEYIRNLKFSFNSKEFINIQFEESDVRKGGAGGSIYGVRIKQNYYSSNYGDSGYLFLIVDLADPNQPVIHVRTWQPTKTAETNIYGLSDF